jgi:hypothetical protein
MMRRLIWAAAHRFELRGDNLDMGRQIKGCGRMQFVKAALNEAREIVLENNGELFGPQWRGKVGRVRERHDFS